MTFLYPVNASPFLPRMTEAWVHHPAARDPVAGARASWLATAASMTARHHPGAALGVRPDQAEVVVAGCRVFANQNGILISQLETTTPRPLQPTGITSTRAP
mmetsp:Transcript_36040/g.58948  ORF Transcript_36040/g.58948 Transcript_36040/m.58948 type:complete len:102 (-) Transcript_36040:297-602(-)